MRVAPRDVVAAGYDRLADHYTEWSERVDDPAREEFVAALHDRVPEGADVLDLGCGDGSHTTRELARRYVVTGVDVSAGQIHRARRNVPGATFLVADLAAVAWPPASFDAVVALYSIIHVPRRRHAALFRRISAWLRPGGWFLASLGADDAPDWTGDWLGVPMFFSSWSAAKNGSLVRRAGFDLEIDEVRATGEPEGDVRFQWVLARRRA